MNVIDGMVNQMVYAARLEKIQKERLPASLTEENYCRKCGSCCFARPCGITKDELSVLAEHHEMSIEDFFKEYLVVDKMSTHEDYVLLFRRYEQEDLAGKFVPAKRTFDIDTPCVMFDMDKDKCKIYDIRPLEARAMRCWDPPEDFKPFTWTREELMKLGWNGRHNEDFIREEEE